VPNLRSMEAARRGWALFTADTPHPAREMINDELVAAGLPGISNRMYTHYLRLERYERHEYIPINELDIEVRGHRPHAA
jgi:hypothetical protein